MTQMNDILRGARSGVTGVAGIPEAHKTLNADIRTKAAAGRHTVEVSAAAPATATPARLQAPSAMLADLRAQADAGTAVTPVTTATEGNRQFPPAHAGAGFPVQVTAPTMNDLIRQRRWNHVA